VVAVDPYLHVLKTMTCDKPLTMWMAQVQEGPTIAVRHEALEALAKTDSSDTIVMLGAVIRDDSLRYTLRNTAADSLAKYGSPQAKELLLAIIAEKPAEARVRSHLVGKLEDCDKEKAVILLADFATHDESYDVRVAAINGLSHHKAKDHADLIVTLVDYSSQSDQVRNAALRAIGEFDDERGLDLAMKYAGYGYMDRARPTAIGVVRKLAKHDNDEAVEFLLKLLSDPESRTISSAGGALADLKDERAVDPLRAMSESNRDPALRERATGWLKALQEKGSGDESTPATSLPSRGRGPRGG
jgi:HEAT repeat protein